METDFVEDTKGAPRWLGRVLILGLGKSGKSVTNYLVNLLGIRVDSLFIAAGTENSDSKTFLESIEASGVSYAFGDDALNDLDDSFKFDLCIASPGIPFWHNLYQQGLQLSTELISEIEFSWRESRADSLWIAISGTNGKTTTTALCAHLLKTCGFKAKAVGNIGDVCLDAVIAEKTDVYVVEVSSYQLASVNHFTPDIAVLLNITPDHIHWHKSFEAYCEAKFKLLDCLAQPHKDGFHPVAILDATNDVVRAKIRHLKSLTNQERGFSYIPLGTADGISGDMRIRCGAKNAAYLAENETLTVAFNGQEHELCKAEGLQIHGIHNVANALAASSVAVALGAKDADIDCGLKTFKPLVHRLEPCGVIDGVECFNDSKATNVDATLVALRSFPNRSLIVLLGGEDKGTDLTPLVEGAYHYAKAVVCFGEATPRFLDAFANSSAPQDFSCLTANHLEDALDTALKIASSGDIIVLSPACASFDEFASYRQRGDVFKELVAKRAEA